MELNIWGILSHWAALAGCHKLERSYLCRGPCQPQTVQWWQKAPFFHFGGYFCEGLIFLLRTQSAAGLRKEDGLVAKALACVTLGVSQNLSVS